MKGPKNSEYDPLRDPNFQVDSLPAPIKAKLTEFSEAAIEYGFRGAYPPEMHAAIEEELGIRAYNLRRAIMTQIEKARKKK